MAGMFEIWTSTLKGKEIPEHELKALNSFVFLRWLSGTRNTVMLANVLNRFPDIPIENQYQVVRRSLHGKLKYIPYPKKITEQEDKEVQYISRFYNVNMQRAKEYRKFISEDEMSQIAHAYEVYDERNPN